jgi:hypothetical protein
MNPRIEDSLESWYRVGDAVGAYLYCYRGGHDALEEIDRLSSEITALIKTASEQTNLPAVRDRVEEARQAFARNKPDPDRATIAEAFECTEARWVDIVQLDARIVQALRSELPVAPVLVLEPDHLTLSGLPIPVEGNRKQIACLWVLAENANKFVGRKEIVDAIKTEYQAEGLPIIVSRLRNILRPLIARHRAVAGGKPLAYEADEYIYGERGKTNAPGRYSLKLEPLQVRVDSKRPNWWPAK